MAIRVGLIVIGVNKGPGAQPLRNAEKDAYDLCDVFVGPLGPVGSDDAVLLVGSKATHLSVISAFRQMIRLKPSHLLVVFSGHGNRDGILLSDGLFSHSDLATCLNAVPSYGKAVMLDCCHAASFYPHIKIGQALDGMPGEAWIEAFARAARGARVMFAARAHESSSDGGPLNNGLFTYGVIDAIQTLSGDIRSGTQSFISLEAVFHHAQQVVHQHAPNGQQPRAAGPISDFPLAFSQMAMPVGSATILPWDHAPRVSCVLHHRRGVRTFAQIYLKNGLGRVLEQRSFSLWPRRDVDSVPLPTDFGLDVVDRDRFSRLIRSSGVPVRLTIEMEVSDMRMRVLAHEAWDVYAPPTLPAFSFR